MKDGIILGSIKDLFLSDISYDERYKKWLEGNEVSRYEINWNGRYICYDPSFTEEELKRKQIKAEEQASSAADYEKLAQSGVRLRLPSVFSQPKILTRQNAKRLIGVYDDEHYFVKNSLHCILLKDRNYNLKYILGLINSSMMNLYFKNEIGDTGQLFSQIKIEYLRKLPIRRIDFTNSADVVFHDYMIALVERILGLHKQMLSVTIPQMKTMLQRQIESTDRQIDQLVYELYELTDEEIMIVKESNH